MKKFLFLAAAMLIFALPAANAQKVNTAKEIAALEKADAACQDAKKNTKAATWIARGKAYTDAFVAPTKDLGRGVPEQMLLMSAGNPSDAYQAEFAGAPAIVYVYEYVDVYVINGMIEGWNQKLAVKENLAQTAIESFAKAYELDPKQDSKIAVAIATLSNSLMEQGNMLNILGRTAEAGEAFDLAYTAQCVAPSFQEDANCLYNAGMLYAMAASTMSGDEAMAMFKKCETTLLKALEAGYKDENGNIYYYLFHSYYAQKDVDRDLYLAKAKEALLTGIKLFPKNTIILDGLMSFYTAEEGVGDPAELVDMIENSLADDPTNYDLWFGRGRVYNALKNYDECIKSFEKCVEIRPEEFDANYFTGYFIIEKANAALEVLNNNTNIGYEQYGEENAKINLIYAEAIPWLEKAHAINPTDAGTIELLNNLCFRLRDLDGMMDKYNKYHELWMQNR